MSKPVGKCEDCGRDGVPVIRVTRRYPHEDFYRQADICVEDCPGPPKPMLLEMYGLFYSDWSGIPSPRPSAGESPISRRASTYDLQGIYASKDDAKSHLRNIVTEQRERCGEDSSHLLLVLTPIAEYQLATVEGLPAGIFRISAIQIGVPWSYQHGGGGDRALFDALVEAGWVKLV